MNSQVADVQPASGTRVVGVSHRRIDGPRKLTGAAKFADDLKLVGLVTARPVLSPHASARIIRIDTAAAAALPGVLGVFTGEDLNPGRRPSPELPLALEKVFYAGQPVAAVVAETEAIATDAAGLVEVEYEVLEPVLDPEAAMRPGAPRVLPEVAGETADAGAHGGGGGGQRLEELPPNVSAAVRHQRGDVAAAIAGAAHVIRHRYQVASVQTAPLEPHVAVARPEPGGGVTIFTPTQGIFSTRAMTGAALGMPVSDVTVELTEVGGGFGSKILLIEPLVAALALRTGRPVKLALTRTEEFLLARPGPSAIVELELGAAEDGHLLGLRTRCVFDNGAGPGHCGNLANLMVGGTYRVDSFDLLSYEVSTNRCPAGAYRAPGGPQIYFPLESAMDELADRLGMDPIQLRLLNTPARGDLRVDGSRFPEIGLRECLEAARAHPLYTSPTAAGEAVGVAVGGWGGGREPAAAACRVDADGRLRVMLGSSDISGSDTSLAMIAAEAFGLRLDQVVIDTGDTGNAPYAGVAGGSKIIYTVGPAVFKAAAEARQQLLEIAADVMEVDPADLVIEQGRVEVKGVPGRSRGIGELADLAMRYGSRYPPVLGHGRSAVFEQSPMFTVHLARVKVDPGTGDFRVTGYAAFQDVGRAINPAEVIGQVHGGAVQSMARALGERVVHDESGQLLTASFIEYALPTIDQVPEIDVELIEVPSLHGPYGAKGVGEPPATLGHAAVANAIYRATGRRPLSMPVDPAELVSGLV